LPEARHDQRAYDWRKKYAGMEAQVLEAENRRLKQMCADLALEKVLIDKNIPLIRKSWGSYKWRWRKLEVDLLVDAVVGVDLTGEGVIPGEGAWHEKFLAMKLLIAQVSGANTTIEMIVNTYSGGHSAAVMTEDKGLGQDFMERVDSAAVYPNASTRFTDDGPWALGQKWPSVRKSFTTGTRWASSSW
jgi:glutamate-5-semialdehyde dehydrogenase